VLIFDKVQMGCLDQVLDNWLVEKIQDPSSELHGKIDTGKMVIAGHSRGAKLAALHYAGPASFPLSRQLPHPFCPYSWLQLSCCSVRVVTQRGAGFLPFDEHQL